jgi:transposase
VGLILPNVNTDMMRLHLQTISEQIPDGRHALIVVDGASWHNQKSNQDFRNITLLKLPPVSPELNPIERIWLYLRQNYLANISFLNYQHIVDSCSYAWNQFAEQSELILSMTHRKWAILD